MVFGNGVKNIQAAAYNGARTVVVFIYNVVKTLKRVYFCLEALSVLYLRSPHW